MNKVSHFHIPVNDMDRAKRFYSSVFGWKISETHKKYLLVITTPISKRGPPKDIGGINGALFERESSEDTISIVIRVHSIEDYLKKMDDYRNRHGVNCKIKTEKTPANSIGFHAEFYDTENNIVGLWEENPDK